MPLDVQKFNVKGCYRILEHSIRYNGKDVNYSNMDIDKTRTSENYHMGIERNNAYGYLKDTVKKYDSIIPPKRIKKDRVILTGFCFTVPESIANTNREREYFEYCYKWLKKQFGEANIITADVHRDEIHKYWDNQKNVWTESRAHMHAEIIPYTQTKGVNCKNFMTKDKLKYWHEDLDQYIYKKMGIHDLVYSESKIVGRNTDMLKKESIEAQAKMVKDLNRQVNQIKLNEGNLEQREQSIISWQDEIEQREQGLTQLENDINAMEDMANKRIESIDQEIKRQDARLQAKKQNVEKSIQQVQQQEEQEIRGIQTRIKVERKKAKLEIKNIQTEIDDMKSQQDSMAQELEDATNRFDKIKHEMNEDFRIHKDRLDEYKDTVKKEIHKINEAIEFWQEEQKSIGIPVYDRNIQKATEQKDKFQDLLDDIER